MLAFFNQLPATEPVFPELTGREREVLALIAAGPRPVCDKRGRGLRRPDPKPKS